MFTLNRNGRVSISAKRLYHVEFEKGSIGEMLGYKPGRYSGYVEGKYEPDLTGGIMGLYIYCDLILPQMVGDSYAPLLRVVPTAVETSEKGILSNIYYSPDYFPVHKKNFSSVEIDIRTDWGERVTFTSGKTLVKLHFREVK